MYDHVTKFVDIEHFSAYVSRIWSKMLHMKNWSSTSARCLLTSYWSSIISRRKTAERRLLKRFDPRTSQERNWKRWYASSIFYTALRILDRSSVITKNITNLLPILVITLMIHVRNDQRESLKEFGNIWEISCKKRTAVDPEYEDKWQINKYRKSDINNYQIQDECDVLSGTKRKKVHLQKRVSHSKCSFNALSSADTRKIVSTITKKFWFLLINRGQNFPSGKKDMRYTGKRIDR